MENPEHVDNGSAMIIILEGCIKACTSQNHPIEDELLDGAASGVVMAVREGTRSLTEMRPMAMRVVMINFVIVAKACLILFKEMRSAMLARFN